MSCESADTSTVTADVATRPESKMRADSRSRRLLAANIHTTSRSRNTMSGTSFSSASQAFFGRFSASDAITSRLACGATTGGYSASIRVRFN